MTEERPAAEPCVYQLTVAGVIGPVLRSALQPHQASAGETYSILLVRRSAARDVVDIVGLLSKRGLPIDGVFTVGPPGADPPAGDG